MANETVTSETVTKAADFSQVFRERIDQIERRALKVGTSLTGICRGIGISRATPDRWRRDIPRTIEIVDQMEGWLDKAEKEKGFAHELAEV